MSSIWPAPPGVVARNSHKSASRLAIPALALLTLALYVSVLPSRWLDVGLEQRYFLGIHTLVELLAVVVSLTLGLTASYTLGRIDAQRASALSMAFVLVACFDMLHVASYAGMPDLLSANSSHKAILFWLLARFVAAAALLAWAAGWPLDATRGATPLLARGALGLAALLGLTALLAPERFPATFEPGQGLTPLKHALEGVIVALNLAALWALRQRAVRGQLRHGDAALRIALWLAALGEGFFLLYSDRVTDVANVIGHLYKLLCYGWLYRAMFINRVRQPFADVALAHAAAARREHEYRDLLELAPDGVLVTDREGRIVLANRALEQMFGRQREALIGKPMETLLPERLRELHRAHRSRYMLAPTGLAMRGRRGLRALHADGHEFDVEVALGVDDGDGEPRLTAYVSDISLRREHERELEFRATHDALTGLPNRWLFADRLAEASRSPRGMALAVLDLDGFQALNESQGTHAGDRLLREVATLLRQDLAPGATLARLGSDEFALLTPLESAADDLAGGALAWAQRLHEDLHRLGPIGAGLSACTGLSICQGNAGGEGLVAQAQLALQAAKAQGRGRLVIYSEQLGERAHRETRIEQRLRLALASTGLCLHYQPQVRVADAQVLGFEALLRWEDAELGNVSPAHFVPVAERAGLMPALGEAVLRMACEQLQRWREQGFTPQVAVNLSPLQFRDAALAEHIVQALQRHQLPSRSMAVEITESAMMDDPGAAAAQLRRLEQAGIEAHLDDFGTGHSSLAWLKNFPIRTIKIDRGFVRDMLGNNSDDAIVRAVIGLAHTLGCTVIAEGVEQQAQLERLTALGCDAYQGWLFAKALPAEEARWLATPVQGARDVGPHLVHP